MPHKFIKNTKAHPTVALAEMLPHCCSKSPVVSKILSRIKGEMVKCLPILRNGICKNEKQSVFVHFEATSDYK